MNRFRKSQSGFTLVELLVVIAIIGVLVGLLLPAVQAAREAARRMSCSNNFKQIGLGVHDYHDAFKQLPQHKTGTGKDPATGAWWDGSNNTNQGQLSWLVPILPFIEQQPLWEKISNPDPYLTNGTLRTPTPWPAFGPKCGNFDYPASMTEINAYRCPSDPGIGLPAQGRTNYACCLGDSISKMETGDRDQNLVATSGDSEWARAGQRGAFVAHKKLGFRDILDGTANTIFGGEINTDLGDEDITTAGAMNRNDGTTGVKARPRDCVASNLPDPLRPRFWTAGTQTLTSVRGAATGRGFQWIHGEHLYTGMNTIIPPNGTLCYQGDWAGQEGAIPPSSRHPGGVHILMGDGAVRFVTDSIEAGNQNERNVEFSRTGNSRPGSKSPYGLWGALGTRASKEILTGEF